MEGWCSVSVPISRASGTPAFTRAFPAGNGEGAGVFNEIYPALEVVRQGFPELERLVSVQGAVEVQPPAPGRNHGGQHGQPFQGCRRIGACLDLSRLEAFRFHDSDSGRADAAGKGGMAGRNVEAGEQADAGGARLPVHLRAFQGPFAQGQRITFPERVQFLLQGMIPQLRPGLDAAVAAFLRPDESPFPAYFRGPGIERAASR